MPLDHLASQLPLCGYSPGDQQAPQAAVFAAPRCRRLKCVHRGHDPSAWLQSPALPGLVCENVGKLVNLSEDGCLWMLGNLTALS